VIDDRRASAAPGERPGALSPASARPVFDCRRAGDRWRLDIRAALPPEWCGNLALHCWVAGIGIASGRATRETGGRWRARFDLVPRDPSDDPARYDFLLMARRRPFLLPTVGRVHLERIEVEPVTGALRVRLIGRDELGFLARVMETFAASDLEPTHLDVRTLDGVAHDWFLLRGTSGAALPADAAVQLRARLERLALVR